MGTNQRTQIVMSPDEIEEFIARSRTATLATTGPDGSIHLVAMWYGIIDGEIWFETKAKSQKAVNLRRNNRCSVLIEDGDTYDTLRGVAIEAPRRSSTTPIPACRWVSRCGSDTPPRTPRNPNPSSSR